MEESVSFLTGTHPETSFDMVVRGYHRGQVEEYVARSSQLAASLEQQLATARADVEQAQAAAAAAAGEVERLRALAVEPKPAHEQVSGRLSQILGLATEEADQKRATAEAEVAKLRRDADEQATQVLADADAGAKRLLDEARQTAERELVEARQRTEELLDEAQRRAGAVDEISARRLSTLAATHGDAVVRLGQIRDVLAEMLARDEAAGSLASVVDAVVAQGRSAATGPLPESPLVVPEPVAADGAAGLDAGGPQKVGLTDAQPAPAAAGDRQGRPHAAAGRRRR